MAKTHSEAAAADADAPGTVFLVGAGPGDPGLLTVRGLERLRSADVVVYDHLASPKLLDQAPRSALRVCAGKSIGHCTMAQDEINAALVEHAKGGKRVVRLKGGDPFLFGRGGEEAEFLRSQGVPFEIIPGVTAGLGATSYAGIPVTHRDDASAVAFVTGHEDPENPARSRPSRLDWPSLARFPGTVVVYMGLTHLESHCRTFIKFGKSPETPAAVIGSGTLPGQTTVVGTLADLAERVRAKGVGAPALLVIGNVVNRRSALSWFENRPLFGRRVLVTRPEADASSATSTDTELLQSLGAEVVSAPCLVIRPPTDLGAIDDAIHRLHTFDWLVFTSANGVRGLLDRIDSVGLDLRTLGSVKLAAIGPSTAEVLRSYHLRADLIPSAFHSEGLTEALIPLAQGKRILLAKGSRGRTTLAEALGSIAHVEEVVVYENADAPTLPDEARQRLLEGSIDWITLTSPATVERLHQLLPQEVRHDIGSRIRLATISPLTTAAAEKLGWKVAVEAKAATWPGVVEAIVKACGSSA